MSKLNIFRKEWLDIVFENRNKAYGAYQLRSENPRTTVIAFFLGISLFGLGISSPIIIKALEGKLGDNIVVEKELPPVVWNAQPKVLPPVKEVIEPEKKVEPTKVIAEPAASTVETKRHVAYVVTDDASKITEEVTKVEDLIGANPGSENHGAKPGGVVNVGDRIGDGTKVTSEPSVDGYAVDGNKVFDFVQFKAEPVGGFAVFNKMFISKFRSPVVGSEVKKIQVIVKFVVEKDGSLSDISILRDPGYGAGKEALRVLQQMPKWKAAVQNNQKVRSQFTLPITIQIH